MKVWTGEAKCQEERLVRLGLKVLVHRGDRQQCRVAIDERVIGNIRSFEGRTICGEATHLVGAILGQKFGTILTLDFLILRKSPKWHPEA